MVVMQKSMAESLAVIKGAFLKSIRKNPDFSSKEKAAIVHAFEFCSRHYGEKIHPSGVPLIVHCIRLSENLLENRVDSSLLILAFLHDLPAYTDITLDDIKIKFSPAMSKLVEGSHKVGMLRKDDESLRRKDLTYILQTMSQDIRIAVLRLMHRLYDVREIDRLEQEFDRILLATETIDLYVPFAGRLGMNVVKAELEDICFRIISPDIYRQIDTHLARSRDGDIDCLEQVQATINRLLRREKIASRMSGRIKSVYSIYRKMVRRSIPFDQVFDKLAIRIIVNDIPTCYQVLGLIHTSYSPIEGTFDDYIALPKLNNYQSLHTAIYPIAGVTFKPVEIQIRTYEMDRHAEFGAASHWLYKSGDFLPSHSEEHLRWIRSLIQLRNNVESHAEFVNALKSIVYRDNTIVFDRLGKVIFLPSKATVDDFARYLHVTAPRSDLIARINGNEECDLSRLLENGDTVEICDRSSGALVCLP